MHRMFAAPGSIAALLVTGVLLLAARVAPAQGQPGHHGHPANAPAAPPRPPDPLSQQSRAAPAVRNLMSPRTILQPGIPAIGAGALAPFGIRWPQPAPADRPRAQGTAGEGADSTMVPLQPPVAPGDSIAVDLRNTVWADLRDLEPLLEQMLRGEKSPRVITEDAGDEALATLVVNELRGALQGEAAKLPGFGDRRDAVPGGVRPLASSPGLTEGEEIQPGTGRASGPEDSGCLEREFGFGGCFRALQGFCDWVATRIGQLGAHEVQERDEAFYELVDTWNYLVPRVTEGGADGDVYFRMLVCLRKQMREACRSDDLDVSGQAQMFFDKLGMDPSADYPDSYHRHEY